MFDAVLIDTLNQRITVLSLLLDTAIAELRDAVTEALAVQQAAIARLQSGSTGGIPEDLSAAIAEVNSIRAALEASIPGLSAAVGSSGGGIPVPSGPVMTSTPATLTAPWRARDFVNSLGVATHNNYNDAMYADTTKVISSLKYLGISLFRDTNFRPEDQGQQALKNVVLAGNRIIAYVRSDATPEQSVARLREYARLGQGALAMIEGFNEINNGGPDESTAQAYMERLYSLVRADNLLKDIPVAGFTNWPESTSRSDFNTIHPYAKQGLQPRDTIVSGMNAQRNAVNPSGVKSDANKPFIITETGYHTWTGASNGGWEGVTELVQAKLILNTYMDAANLGVKYTCVYQLLDDRAGDHQEQHFGLFRFPDYSPKPAATAIRNLTTILADAGMDAGTFTLEPLQGVMVAGSAHSFLLQKSDGSNYVVLWAEPPVWDPSNHFELVSPITQLRVEFGKEFGTVELYDPLVGVEPIRTFTNSASVSVGVTDHPVLVRLK